MSLIKIIHLLELFKSKHDSTSSSFGDNLRRHSDPLEVRYFVSRPLSLIPYGPCRLISSRWSLLHRERPPRRRRWPALSQRLRRQNLLPQRDLCRPRMQTRRLPLRVAHQSFGGTTVVLPRYYILSGRRKWVCSDQDRWRAVSDE